ncbi:MAG TPA: AarF/UbiB family protein [Acidimicrobiales bacterium]
MLQSSAVAEDRDDRTAEERAFVVPKGRLRRTLPLAGATARTVAGGAARWVRMRGMGDDERSARELEFHARHAARYAELLGDMKGAMMKVGQLLSFVDSADLVPEPYREVYRTALAQLQADAPPMPPDLVAEIVEAELGERPDVAFDWFSPLPLAAASIGQVHAAHLRDGREVAVKVQYPGVAEAIEADLRNGELLAQVLKLGQSMLGPLAPKVDARAVADEVRDRVGEELDYRTELANQQLFYDLYREHPTIRIPYLVPERSAARVLTMELVDGMRWAAAIEAPRELRDQWGAVIACFVYGSLYTYGVFNADPHPGNYLFHEDGSVTFLDFGCIKRFEPQQVEHMKVLERAVLRDDPELLRSAFVALGFLGEEAPPADELMAWYRPLYEPVLAPQPATYTHEYAAASVRRHFDPLGPSGKLIRRFDLPRDFMFLGRIVVGLNSVLAGLGATADWRAIADEVREASPA